jgi:hypothetical protein
MQKPNKDPLVIQNPDTNTKQLYATLTFVGKETKKIANLFKNTNIKIAYRTPNTLGKLLITKPNNNKKDKYLNSGVYRLTCPNCGKIYTGQTGRNFKIRYKEHLLSYKHGNYNSKFTHLLENKHSFGDIKNIITPICYNRKGVHLNTLEKFYTVEPLITDTAGEFKFCPL